MLSLASMKVAYDILQTSKSTSILVFKNKAIRMHLVVLTKAVDPYLKKLLEFLRRKTPQLAPRINETNF